MEVTSGLASPGPTLAASEYRPDIDGLRALAALSVLATHTVGRAVPGGRTGVDMFFVLSGFLISGIILRALARGNFEFRDFYSRRIRRIFPALLVVLLAVWIAGAIFLLPEDFERLGKGIATNAAFSWYIFAHLESNFWDLYVTDHGGMMLAQLWSLGVEEQFYLLWPLFLVAIWKLIRANVLRVAVAIALIALVSFFFTLERATLPSALAIVPWRGISGLSLGGLLACIQQAGFFSLSALRERPAKPRNLVGLATHQNSMGFVAVALLATAIFSDPREQVLPSLSILFPAVGTLLFIAAGPASVINRVIFASRPMVFIGLISYPLYLWHFPVVIFADLFSFNRPLDRWILFVLVLSASIALAFLTYRYIELPIRRQLATSRVVVRLAGAMLACGLIGIATLLGLVRPLSYHYGGEGARAATENWLSASKQETWTRFQDAPILLGSEPSILFMGDSNMQQYYPRIEQLHFDQRSRVRSAVFTARFGCVPGIAALHITSETDRRLCADYVSKTTRIASDPRIETVVIAACWYVYFAALSDRTTLGQQPAGLRPGTDAALAELRKLMYELTSHGKTVYLVLNIPVGRDLDPRALAGLATSAAPPDTRLVMNASSVRAALNPIHARLRRIATEVGAITIDPLESLCDSANCPSVSARGTLMYRDLWHLRPSYVRNEVSFLDAIVLQ